MGLDKTVFAIFIFGPFGKSPTTAAQICLIGFVPGHSGFSSLITFSQFDSSFRFGDSPVRVGVEIPTVDLTTIL